MIEVLFFSAPWCSACKTAKPVVEAAAKESGYTFRYIDIEENSTNSKLSAKMDVSSLPTSVILKDGKERLRWEGAFGANVIDSKMRSVV